MLWALALDPAVLLYFSFSFFSLIWELFIIHVICMDFAGHRFTAMNRLYSLFTVQRQAMVNTTNQFGESIMYTTIVMCKIFYTVIGYLVT